MGTIKRILITGGAGFIGSHLADELLRHDYSVRALDNLSPQVHGEARRVPAHLHPSVELRLGDVRSRGDVRAALEGIDAVFHLAAAVGVGQSMYRIAEYTSVNNQGTACLLEQLVAQPVKKLIVASSMSVYGEGLYKSGERLFGPTTERSVQQLKSAVWEMLGPEGEALSPVPTPETKTPSLASVYALSKYDQERLCLMVGRAYGIPSVALRLFNVYGPFQALSNPYTGVMAIFASRLLNGRPPMIFEDGLQRRDFVSVHDVARAFRLALESEAAVGQVINIGSGASRTVLHVARQMATAMSLSIEPSVTGQSRAGDVRHCFADITLARTLLDFQPSVRFPQGMTELVQWLSGQQAQDRVADAKAELEARGLTL
jgi:dTDP-L-rhamnose 4-epimerase